jgi:hypothetical protein
MYFHATPAEIRDWLAPLQQRFGLHVVAVKWNAKDRYRAFDWDLFAQEAASVKADFLRVDTSPISLGDPPGLDGRLDGRGAMTIYLPRKTRTGIRGGMINDSAGDAKRIRIWAAIIRKFRKETSRGAWVAFGDDVFFDNMEHLSPAIAETNRLGQNLTPFAGRGLLFIDKPNPKRTKRKRPMRQKRT